MKLFTIPAVILLVSSFGFSATIYVPDNYATIQGAINASSNGDTIIVRPGTYVENIDFVGKAIHVQSDQGPIGTTIDGNSLDSVVVFRSGEGLDSVLEGFTVTNGNGLSPGGGIYCESSSPVIKGNWITDNEGYNYGGGVCCVAGSTPDITENLINHNRAYYDDPIYLGGSGGGIYCDASSPSISDNRIENNTAAWRGAGIFCENGSTPVIDGNNIEWNETYYYGAGIASIDSTPTITNNFIYKNKTDDLGMNVTSGAGISLQSSSAIIRGNTIKNNPGAWYGGGIYCGTDSHATIDGNIISNNSARQGGGIHIAYCDPQVTNNTISQNSAGWGGGGGINCSRSSSSTTIANNIISGNTADDGGGMQVSGYATPLIINNLIVGNKVNGSHCQGGGINVDYSEAAPTIKNCMILNNSAESGGGICCATSTFPLIVDTVIAGNSVSKWGGGIYCWGGDPTIVNCTIIHNKATDSGGGIFGRVGMVALSTNTIWWQNSAPTGPEISVADVGGPSTFSISYSDVEGGIAQVYVEAGCTLNWGARMIDADPLFADSSNGDAHLTWNSPCRDTGDNTVVTELDDFEGDPRIALGTVDMGADEYYYHLYHKGDVIPGSPIDIKVVGYPRAPITLYFDSGLADPPYSTQHGVFFLNWPPLWQGNIGMVPSDGIFVLPTIVPTGWPPGSEHYLQSLIGPWGGPHTCLSNLLTLTVE